MAWPTSIATNTDLYLAANLKKTTLNGGITNVQTTITLTSTTGLPTKGIVLIVTPNADPTLGELVEYAGISGSDLTGCTRGFGGTTGASHSNADDVFLVVAAEHHNVLKDEVIAVETDLSNHTGLGTIVTTSVNITVSTEQEVLVDATAGARVITLPAVASSNKRHITIKKIDASVNTVTVDANASELIDGALTRVISVQYESYTFVCNGTTWNII